MTNKKRVIIKDIQENDTVTFYFDDETTQIQTINKGFLFTNNGKRKKSMGAVINDLNGIKHDLSAKYFQL